MIQKIESFVNHSRVRAVIIPVVCMGHIYTDETGVSYYQFYAVNGSPNPDINLLNIPVIFFDDVKVAKGQKAMLELLVKE